MPKKKKLEVVHRKDGTTYRRRAKNTTLMKVKKMLK